MLVVQHQLRALVDLPLAADMQAGGWVDAAGNGQFQHLGLGAHYYILVADGELGQLHILVDVEPTDEGSLSHELHTEVLSVYVVR